MTKYEILLTLTKRELKNGSAPNEMMLPKDEKRLLNIYKRLKSASGASESEIAEELEKEFIKHGISGN